LILASQSPRRKEILEMMGLQGKFEATPSPLDESALQNELLRSSTKPIEYTRILAERKALALAESLVFHAPTTSAANTATKTTTTTLVLGSDTIVAFDDCILEKPVDAADAVRMLTMLQGNHHEVYTGVALVRVSHDGTEGVQLVECFTDTATVQFAALTEADIRAYVETGEPMDKAGSYGIQGMGGQIVASVHGDFFTV
jgi:septum formation protein